MKKYLYLVLAICLPMLSLVSCDKGDDSNDDNGDDPQQEFTKHDYVDLGLSVEWATCNVGAEKPEEYGDYFAWGETAGYNSGRTYFDWSNYKWSNGTSGFMTKYCINSSDGTVDGITVLVSVDDAATANWGSDWRMPTKAELDELVKNCTWTWTNENGVNGYKITSKTNGNSIFLPANGGHDCGSCNGAGLLGFYWASSLCTEELGQGESLVFNSRTREVGGSCRSLGAAVRPVRSDIQPIYVTEIKLSATSMEIGLNDSIQLSAAITPSDATVQGIIWTSDNKSVVKVSATGLVTSIGLGTATITAKAKDGSGISATCKVTVKDLSETRKGVDLGLSALWATCNIGAEKPEDFGDYFSWGETTGYKSGKTDFTWETYKWCNGSSTTQTKYCVDSKYGTVDNIIYLEPNDDAAIANWGGNWRMPTQTEIVELKNNCSWEVTKKNGVDVCMITSKINGNSIVLPFAGYRNGTQLIPGGAAIWTSWLHSAASYYAVAFAVDSYNKPTIGGCNRYFGVPVRPVRSDASLIKVTGITLSETKVELDFNSSIQLTATITPSNASLQGLTWSSGNNRVATVNETGLVNIIGVGSATIIATAKDGSNVSAICIIKVKNSSETHEYVDLGLSVKWATCNVGAEKPQDYGDYFAWGETTGYNGGKKNFGWDTYKWCKGSEKTQTKYCNDSSYGTVDNKTVLQPTDDAAIVNWSGDWRMPTSAELQELKDNCNWKWTKLNGVNGYLVSSKVNGNSIFLPAAGYCYATRSPGNLGSRGYYWSSSLCTDNNHRALYLQCPSGNCIMTREYRYYGYSVRPVRQ